jgi:hypothetical protein
MVGGKEVGNSVGLLVSTLLQDELMAFVLEFFGTLPALALRQSSPVRAQTVSLTLV